MAYCGAPRRAASFAVGAATKAKKACKDALVRYEPGLREAVVVGRHPGYRGHEGRFYLLYAYWV